MAMTALELTPRLMILEKTVTSEGQDVLRGEFLDV